jgi:hypothetical protein
LITGLEAHEAIFRARRNKVISFSALMGQKGLRHDGADDMGAVIQTFCLATSVAEPARQWIQRANLKRTTQNITRGRIKAPH